VPEEGGMALFCAACPQDGVNLSPGWKDEDNLWRFNTTLVADGNFSLIHRAQKSTNDVWLKSGEGYLVEREQYRYHIKHSKEPKHVSP
jgi:hypothetical protein